MRRWLVATAVWVILNGLAAAHAEELGVGFRQLQLKDPVGGGPMQAVVFYPSSGRTKPTTVGLYLVDAAPEAALLGGKHGLIVLSHGSGGSALGHHDLATTLARRGFIVAAVEHPRDNYRDLSGFGTAAVLVGRSRQLSALIDRMLADSIFGKNIQPEQIGAAGFSAGGYTVLTLAGARADFGLVSRYCRKYPRDRNFCAPRRPQSAEAGLIQADRRVRAVFAMAPVGVFFDRPGLAAVTIPVYLYAAQKDTVLLPSENTDRIRKDLPRAPEYTQIAGVGHYIFLAPCAPEQAAFIPNLCTDPPGIDRRAIHTRLNADAATFFSRVLTDLSATAR